MIQLFDFRSPKGRTQVCHPRRAQSSDGKYRDGAFVPDGAWVEIAPDNVTEIAVEDADWDFTTSIAFSKMSSSSVDILRGFWRSLTMREHGTRESSYEAVVEMLLPLCSSPDHVEFLGVWEAPPGQVTITPPRPAIRHDDGSEQSKTRIGLHLDSTSASKTVPAPWNRICINIGAEPRSFLFVPTSYEDLVSATVLAEEKLRRFGIHGTGDTYLNMTPNAVVVRIEMLPGDMYIAPTYHLLHDASTASMTCDDRAFHVSGVFRPV